jgi:excisionase family DNA binding protein
MERAAFSVDELGRAGGPKRAKAYEEIRKGNLRAVKIGRSTRILAEDFRAYLASLPAIEPKAAAQPEPNRQGYGRRRDRS